MSRLAILTPTYNRGKDLGRLFRSLCAQTSMEFEWWIVDDGSTDDTRNVARSFEDDAPFSIHYIYKENGGKHTALNRAIPKIASELTMIVDSDDTLRPDAVETIFRYDEKYRNHPGLCGYVFHRQFPDGTISGKRFVPDERIASYIDVRINGDDTYADKAEVFYTKCLQAFPFPEYPGEKFLSEDVVWIPMGRKYKMVHINEAIYQFEYQNDGLTKNRRSHNISSPRGCVYRSSLYMEKDIKLKHRIRGALQYLVYGKFAGDSVQTLLSETPYRLLTALLILPAELIYAVWNRNPRYHGTLSSPQ